MLKSIIIVGTGGFFGSVARYLTQVLVGKIVFSSFPYGTLVANILGSFIIGLVYGMTEKGDLISPELRIFLAVGFCGGYTTFSSFAYNNLTLLKDSGLFLLFANITISIVLGMFATFVGITLVRYIFNY